MNKKQNTHLDEELWQHTCSPREEYGVRAPVTDVYSEREVYTDESKMKGED